MTDNLQILDNQKVNNVDVFGDDLDYYLQEYCDTRGIEDIYNIPDQQWTAALMYICQHTFKIDNSSLKVPGNINNAYDLNAVSILADRYIYMCFDHNQKISISGFCCLSGIDIASIYSWKDGNARAYIYYDLQGNRLDDYMIRSLSRDQYIKKPTSSGMEIYKKLLNFEEQSLQDRLTDRRRNPMHTLPLWNSFQAKQQARQEKPVYDVSDVARQLGIADQIAALPDNGGK